MTLSRKGSICSVLSTNLTQLLAALLGVEERPHALYRPAEAWAVAASAAWLATANLPGGLAVMTGGS